jgi:hypothetical protein
VTRTPPSKAALATAFGAVAALAITVAVLIANIPAVKGLGDKVKLPLFHGGSTWVDLMLFVAMGVLALVYIIGRKDSVYAWEVGFRSVAAPLWVINTVLGLIAALNTWDFTGSKESPLMAVRQDPRLVAQFVLLLGIAMLLLLHWLVLEKRLHKAIADLSFTVIATIILSDIFLDPAKRALHPDSPVLNSGWEIKGPFFGMVVAVLGIGVILAWVIQAYVQPEKPAEPTEALPESAA